MAAADAVLSGSVAELAEVEQMLARVAALRMRQVLAVAAAAREDHEARQEQDAAVSGRPLATPRGQEARDVLDRSVRLEVAAALRVSESAAGMLLLRAREAVEEHPDVIEAMEAGSCSEAHARVLLDGVRGLDWEAAQEVVGTALPLTARLTPGKVERRLRPLVERVRDEDLTRRHERARAERGLYLEHGQDGMSALTLVTDSVTAQAAYERATRQAVALERAARDAGQPETRTRDQLRADVVADTLIDGETGCLPEAARGIRAEVAVTVPVLSLMSGDDRRHGQASLRGVGPIPIQAARELAGAASGWMRVLTDPWTSMVLDVDRSRYRPPAELARVAKWAYGTCTAPGCRVDAARCELDHITAWDDGGRTGFQNLHPACKGHHALKHASRWAVDPPGPGRPGPVWHSPGGTATRAHAEHELAPPF